MLHFNWRNPNKKYMILIAIAATVMASLWEYRRDPVSGLHTAEAPVRGLMHHSDDPTVAFPESFPLQVAVYWSKPDEGLLEIVVGYRLCPRQILCAKSKARSRASALQLLLRNR